MAVYEYRCATDGGFDVTRPIGTAAATAPCPRCDEHGARVFSAPRVGLAPGALVSALDRAGATSDSPEVVTSLPGRGARPARVSTHPAHRSLPRP